MLTERSVSKYKLMNTVYNTQEIILQTASRLFEQYGYKNVSFAQIAEESGVAYTQIFQYFLDKQELLQQLIDYLLGKEELVDVIHRLEPMRISQ